MIVDGAKALDAAVTQTFGRAAVGDVPCAVKLSGGSVHDYATIADDSPRPSRASRARRAATRAGISLHPFTRRNPFAASSTPAATQRSTIVPPRQRFTFRFTWRVRLSRLSMAFVVASDRWRRSDSPRPSTVRVSSSPSRTLAACTRVVGVQATREVLQQTRRRLDVAVRIGAREDRLHPRTLRLGEMLQDVPALMNLTPLHDGRPAERLGHRGVEGLRPIDDHQEAPVGAKSAAHDWSTAPDRPSHSRWPLPRGQADVWCPIYRCPGRPRYSGCRRAPHRSAVTARSRLSSGVARHASNCAWVCATKRRLTALLLVPRVVISAPSGSRLRVILAGRDADEHLVDDPPVQRVRIRERPHGRQRHLRAGAAGTRGAESRPCARPTRPDWGHARPGTPVAPLDADYRGPHTRRPIPLRAWPRAPSGPRPRPAPGAQPRYPSGLSTNGRWRTDGDSDWRRRVTVRDCCFMAASLLGGLHLGLVTGRIA